jgi:predicted metal-dependent HD superfamily phosphohydrolase
VNDILNLAKGHVDLIFENPGWGPFTFHSALHTRSVFEKAKEWSACCVISQEHSEALQLAALFHDIGYLSNYEDHEAEGIRMFLNFADANGIPTLPQNTVIELIECTRETHSDFSKPISKIMHDIDRVAMGMADFIDQGLNLRKEWEHFKRFKTNDKGWLEFQIQYLEKTKFKTEYGLSKYNLQRERNLQSLKALLADTAK